MASLADMLSKGLGSKLEGNNHDTIKEDKKNPKKSSNELKNYLASAKWNGKTKDTFEAYLSLIRQYHDDLIDIMKDHEKALNNLKKKVDEYNSSSEVSSIKGL